MTENPYDLLSMVDIRTRWIYSRGAIWNLSQKPNFPEPVATVSNGKIKLWTLAQIAEYEKLRPELTDAIAKAHKIRWYALHMTGGEYNP